LSKHQQQRIKLINDGGSTVIDSNDRTLTILHSTTVFISVVIITVVFQRVRKQDWT